MKKPSKSEKPTHSKKKPVCHKKKETALDPLLELRLMNIESRLGTLEHYTRGYEYPRQTIPEPKFNSPEFLKIMKELGL
jgi:hypothetical protein